MRGFGFRRGAIGGDGFSTTFTPDAGPRPLMWFQSNKALSLSGSFITTWGDQSGNGLDASQIAGRRPTYNPDGKNTYPSLVFSQLLTSSLATANVNMGSFTVFIIGKAAATSSLGICYEHGTNINSSTGSIFQFTSGASPTLGVIRGLPAINSGTTSLKTWTAGGRRNDIYTVYCHNYSGFHSGHFIEENGVRSVDLSDVLITGIVMSASLGESSSVGPFNIGGRFNNTATNRLTGEILEVIVYTPALNDATRINITRTLQKKYWIF